MANTTPDNSDWLVIALGMTGADFHVLDPPELAGRLKDWAARFTRATAEPPARPPRRMPVSAGGPPRRAVIGRCTWNTLPF